MIGFDLNSEFDLNCDFDSDLVIDICFDWS